MPREPYSRAENRLIFFARGKEAQHLREMDDELAALIDELEVVSVDIDGDGFRALARAIVDQQISIHAARAIWLRLEDYCAGLDASKATQNDFDGGDDLSKTKTETKGARRSGFIGSADFVSSQSFVTAETIAVADDEEMRACGLSRSKIAALKDLAAHVHDGRIDFDQLSQLDDEEVIEILTQVRGIGRWTAQMHLIFALGRHDVFAVNDGALRRAVEKLKGLPPSSSPELIEAIAEDWIPYRTVAALYLWKSLQ